MRCGSGTSSGPAEQGGFLFRLTIGLRKIDGNWLITHEHHSVPATDYRPGQSRLFHAGFLRREFVDRAAELAGHDHLAVLHHVGAVFAAKLASIDDTASREHEHCARSGNGGNTRTPRS